MRPNRSDARVGLILLVAALGLMVSSCSGERSADGGAGTDTDNILTARLVDSVGAPLVGARAWILSPDSIRDSGTRAPDAAGISDSAGFLRLRLDRSNRVRSLEVRAGGVGMVRTFEEGRGGGVSLGDLRALRLSRVSGKVPADLTGRRAWVCVSGTTRCALSDSAGIFRLDSVPSGSSLLASRISASATLTRSVAPVAGSVLDVGNVVDTVVWRLAASGVVMEDFSRSGSPSLIQLATGAGGWYTAVSAGTRWQGGTTGPVFTDSGLAMDVAFDSASDYAIVGLYFKDAKIRRNMDWSGLDSLCVVASGAGDLTIRPQRYQLDTNLIVAVGSSFHTLSATPRSFCLVRSDLGADSTLLLSGVNNLTLNLMRGTRVQIRRITVHGVPYSSFLKP